MKIELTPEESENYFYNALCNAVGTGYIESYGIELKYNKEDYGKAAIVLKEKGKLVCYEDILMEILRMGNPLTMVDHENGEDPISVYLKDIHERVKNAPSEHLLDMHYEKDDACTGDVIIQTVFYNDVIFG
jgi:hypothetical protein